MNKLVRAVHSSTDEFSDLQKELQKGLRRFIVELDDTDLAIVSKNKSSSFLTDQESKFLTKFMVRNKMYIKVIGNASGKPYIELRRI